jgi:hypothetical protein
MQGAEWAYRGGRTMSSAVDTTPVQEQTMLEKFEFYATCGVEE